MTIDNIVLIFVYMFWFYFILIFLFKLLKDQINKLGYEKKTLLIKKFFRYKTDNEKYILKCLQDVYLLEYACNCFMEEYVLYSDFKKTYYGLLLNEALELYRIRNAKMNVYERMMLDNIEKSILPLVKV